MNLANTLKAAQTEDEKTALDHFKDRVKALAETPPGARNDVLNSTAFVAGTLIAQEHVSEDWALDQLLDACIANDYGPDAERVAKAGIEAGIKEEGDKRKKGNPIYGWTLNSRQLRSLPPAKWQIGGVVMENSLVVLYGPPETGKSFLAMDMVGCLANRNNWIDHIIPENESALYILGEGYAGLADRVAAWEEHNGVSMRNVDFVTRPILSGTKHWQYLVDYAADMKPGMVVIDTLSRMANLESENDSASMNKFIKDVDAIRAATGKSVMVIHHTGRMGFTPRGSNALDGAADTMIKVEPGGGDRSVDVFTTKLKEGSKPSIGSFTFKSVGRSAVLVKERNLSW